MNKTEKYYICLCKDNRVRLVHNYIDGSTTTSQYCRFLMEQKLCRYLGQNEDVHHLDENPMNNHISNLKVIDHKIHCRDHNKLYVDTKEICIICGNKFTMTSSHWTRFFVDRHIGRKRSLTCSKSCTGKLSSGKYKLLYNLDERLLNKNYLKSNNNYFEPIIFNNTNYFSPIIFNPLYMDTNNIDIKSNIIAECYNYINQYNQ